MQTVKVCFPGLLFLIGCFGTVHGVTNIKHVRTIHDPGGSDMIGSSKIIGLTSQAAAPLIVSVSKSVLISYTVNPILTSSRASPSTSAVHELNSHYQQEVNLVDISMFSLECCANPSLQLNLPLPRRSSNAAVNKSSTDSPKAEVCVWLTHEKSEGWTSRDWNLDLISWDKLIFTLLHQSDR